MVYGRLVDHITNAFCWCVLASKILCSVQVHVGRWTWVVYKILVASQQNTYTSYVFSLMNMMLHVRSFGCAITDEVYQYRSLDSFIPYPFVGIRVPRYNSLAYLGTNNTKSNSKNWGAQQMTQMEWFPVQWAGVMNHLHTPCTISTVISALIAWQYAMKL